MLVFKHGYDYKEIQDTIDSINEAFKNYEIKPIDVKIECGINNGVKFIKMNIEFAEVN